MSVPPETFHRIPGDECSFIVNGLHGEEQRPCTEWDFDNSSFASTITSEFLLVCGRTFLTPLYQSFFMIGSSIGAILGGILSDKFGRRLIVILGITLFLVIAACSSWLPNLSLIFIARFCIGFLDGDNTIMDEGHNGHLCGIGMGIVHHSFWRSCLYVAGVERTADGVVTPFPSCHPVVTAFG
uniref:Major facilitator superfamily (MFS) profile domain-containing protein n=1 Tax=Scylla olivacea TaxID=85551 RepID=A0A0P4W8B7_SCYOL